MPGDVYAWFSEGPETGDLREAQTLGVQSAGQTKKATTAGETVVAFSTHYWRYFAAVHAEMDLDGLPLPAALCQQTPRRQTTAESRRGLLAWIAVTRPGTYAVGSHSANHLRCDCLLALTAG